MTFVLTFKTSRFAFVEEPENPINPIRGYAVALWAKEELEHRVDSISTVDHEDWGWYLDTVLEDQSYMLGFCINSEDAVEEVIVQIEKHRSIIQKIFRINRMGVDDPLLALMRTAIINEFGSETLYESSGG